MTVRLGRLLPSLAGQSPWLQWAILILLSIGCVAALEALHLPAALLLGPMAAAVLVAAAEGTVRVPPLPFIASQGVIGAMIARSITGGILAEMLKDWPMFAVAILSVIGASGLIGWVLTRMRVLPGTTAIWGSSPGAATAMTLMSESYGGDIRLVAFMQYLRVVMVAVAASLVSRIWAVPDGSVAAGMVWFPPVAWVSFAETLLLAEIGVAAGRLLRVPAGSLLLPLAFCAVLQGAGLLTVELPPWLLALCYAMVGWSIGMRFTRPIIVYAARALPVILASTLSLIGICGLFSVILTKTAGVDPLTAYLAMSPGGADSVAIIAASSKVDLPFVMALQTIRLLVVILTGPSLARLITGRVLKMTP
ncbi:MAG TPA: AbrB family transcriptional regulator [Aliidongia sp.]|nr:AbrB family transcriptional regulator [Aliidongia sp.]